MSDDTPIFVTGIICITIIFCTFAVCLTIYDTWGKGSRKR